ncbi:MAG: hypothetical protein ACI8R9_002081, partial [Paraglaciecola sp.]
MPGAFYNSFSWPEGRKAWSLKSTHVVVYVDKILADGWDTNEVLRRYRKLHKGTLLTHKYLKGDKLSSGELITFDETIEQYRQRLYDISWFMRNLNEYIAREANKE